MATGTAAIKSQLLNIEKDVDWTKCTTIETTQNLRALIDLHWYDEVAEYRWFANGTGNNYYAVADVEGKRISLQRFIMGLSTVGKVDFAIKEVTFVNKCRFDCREQNLKTNFGRTSIARNRLKKRGSSSQYKGCLLYTSDAADERIV